MAYTSQASSLKQRWAPLSHHFYYPMRSNGYLLYVTKTWVVELKYPNKKWRFSRLFSESVFESQFWSLNCPPKTRWAFFQKKSVSSFTGQDPFEMFGTPRDAWQGRTQGHVPGLPWPACSTYIYTLLRSIFIYCIYIYIYIYKYMLVCGLQLPFDSLQDMNHRASQAMVLNATHNSSGVNRCHIHHWLGIIHGVLGGSSHLVPG